MNHVSQLVTRYQARGTKNTSSQDFSILDQLLSRALAPLEAESIAFREWLGEVLAFSLASRRKPSTELISACFAGLCGVEGVAASVVEAGADRELVFSFLNRVTDIGTIMEKAQAEYICRRANRTDQRNLEVLSWTKLILGPSSSLTIASRTATYWLRAALRHKEWIISNYLRLFFQVSARLSHASGGMVEQDAAFAEAFLAADMAVNRFHSHMGVFATYLGAYLKGGSRLSASQALGLATPGARITSAEAIQTESVDSIDVPGVEDFSEDVDLTLLAKINAVSSDPDIRAALMLSDVVPPTAATLRASDDSAERRSRRLAAMSK